VVRRPVAPIARAICRKPAPGHLAWQKSIFIFIPNLP
jgi:hypothetical protein